jgi:hypothetical protein
VVTKLFVLENTSHARRTEREYKKITIKNVRGSSPGAGGWDLNQQGDGARATLKQPNDPLTFLSLIMFFKHCARRLEKRKSPLKLGD